MECFCSCSIADLNMLEIGVRRAQGKMLPREDQEEETDDHRTSLRSAYFYDLFCLHYEMAVYHSSTTKIMT